jgi:hypothetical protein
MRGGKISRSVRDRGVAPALLEGATPVNASDARCHMITATNQLTSEFSHGGGQDAL